MNSPSLHQRLGRGITLGLLLLFGLQYLGMEKALEHFSQSYLLSRLSHDQETLLQALSLQAGGILLLDTARISPTFQRPFSGHYYLIQSESLSLASRSLWNHPLNPAALAPGEQRVERLAGPDGRPMLLFSQGFHKQGQNLTVSVGEELGLLEQQLSRFRIVYALFSLFFLLVLLWLQRSLLQIGLKPLSALEHEMLELEKGSRTALSTTVPSELRALVWAFNRLLQLMQARLQRSREALGDLSHALKRPLTRIYQLLEQQPWPELQAQAQSLEQLIEQELQRARMAGSARPGLSVSLSEAVTELLAVLKPVYAARQLQTEIQIPAELRVFLDREDLLEMLGNLLDNACKWAQSQIEVEAQAEPTGWWLEIRDDGPGCPPGELQALTQRGVRADEQRPGHGLGLAIANRIVLSYGGTLVLSNRSPGFSVRITVPEKIS